jgi:hypothetical protein
MRAYLILGVSLASACLLGCGDDSGSGITANGNGGSVATGGTGGTAGAGGSSGAAGTGSAQALCSGCVELEIPFTASGQGALYQISYSAPGLDFSNAVVTWKAQTTTPNDGIVLQPRAQNGSRVAPAGNTVYPGYYGAPTKVLSSANFPADTWTDVVLDFTQVAAFAPPADAGAGAQDAGTLADAGDAGADASPSDAGTAAAAPPANTVAFDKSEVEALQLYVSSMTGDAVDVILLLDAVDITGVPGQTGVNFTVTTDGLSLNNYAGSPTPPGTPAPVAR